MNRTQVHYLSWICRKMWDLEKKLDPTQVCHMDFLRIGYSEKHAVVENPKMTAEYPLDVFPTIEDVTVTLRLLGVKLSVHSSAGVSTIRVNAKRIPNTHDETSNFTLVSPTNVWRLVRNETWR